MANRRTTKTRSLESRRADITRISDQLATYRIVRQHIQHHTIQELQFYPGHPNRKDSGTAEYRAAHNRMVNELDLPCLACGVRASTLNNQKVNRYGAKQMETHHHIIEWSLANAIDVGRFNQQLRPALAHKHPGDPDWEYEKPFDQKKVRDWVDHSEHNLWVLCDVHHRARYLGIHEITYPIWAPMDLLRADFEQWAVARIKELKEPVLRKRTAADRNQAPSGARRRPRPSPLRAVPAAARAARSRPRIARKPPE